MGLFNTAVSFHRSADHLAAAKVKVPHREFPVRFLYYHCFELYLKAFLRMHSVTPRKLQEIGHKPNRLQFEAERRGFVLSSEDHWVLQQIASSDSVIRSHYIETGAFSWPALESLTRTAEALRKTTRDGLNAAGEPVMS